MLSNTSRQFAWALAGLYALLGAIMFVAPTWASANFAWNISPMVAMTIGGWCLGNAWAAFIVARRATIVLVASGLAYLSLFGLIEAGVLLAFIDKLKAGSLVAWLYLATLAVNTGAAAVWAIELARTRSAFAAHPFRAGQAVIVAAFILFVGFLGLYGLFAPEGSRGLSGGIFPEVLTPFTLRAFGGLYLSIALAPILFLITRNFQATLSHMLLSWGLIFFITIAGLVFIDRFDFAARPGQWLYFGTYALVGAVTLGYMLRYGTGRAD
jgi:hypothetical protein